jgi:excisionase family DNA binding protein
MSNDITMVTKVTPDDPLLTVTEVTDYLRLGETKVREMIADGELPAAKYHRKTLVRQSAVEDYINRHTFPTNSQDNQGEK